MKNSTVLRILENTQYATIATSNAEGKPWNTPVFFAYDEDGCIYWSSHPESVHSKNIAANPRAFIVVYNSKAAEGEGVGLYVDSTVEMLIDASRISTALTTLGKRRGRSFEYPEKFIGEGPQRIYKATPQKMWLNNAVKDADGDFIRDYRDEVS